MTALQDFTVQIRPVAEQVAFQMIGDHDAAQDVASEAILQLLRAEERLVKEGRDVENLRAYFFAILRNNCRTYWRRRVKDGTLPNIQALPEASSSQPLSKSKKLANVLNVLDEATQACLIMLGMGYDYREISQQLGVGSAAVAGRVRRARKCLLEEHGTHLEDIQVNLSELNVMIPPKAEGTETANQVAARMGCAHRTAKRRLHELLTSVGLMSERRRCGNGSTYDHFTSELVARCIQESLKYQEAGDWLTVNRIAVLAGESFPWVQARLEELGTEKEKRRHTKGRVYWHYPPSALAIIQALSSRRVRAEGTFTVRAISLELGWTKQRVKKSLKVIEATPSFAEDVQGNKRAQYTREVIEKLKALPVYPPKGNWVNRKELLDGGACKNWGALKKRLALIPLTPEWRTDQRNNDSLCYPPSIWEYFTKSE